MAGCQFFKGLSIPGEKTNWAEIDPSFAEKYGVWESKSPQRENVIGTRGSPTAARKKK